MIARRASDAYPRPMTPAPERRSAPQLARTQLALPFAIVLAYALSQAAIGVTAWHRAAARHEAYWGCVPAFRASDALGTLWPVLLAWLALPVLGVLVGWGNEAGRFERYRIWSRAVGLALAAPLAASVALVGASRRSGLRDPTLLTWFVAWPLMAVVLSRAAQQAEPRIWRRWLGVVATLLTFIVIDVCNVALWWQPFARVSPW